jgi:hypothetical protein
LQFQTGVIVAVGAGCGFGPLFDLFRDRVRGIRVSWSYSVIAFDILLLSEATNIVRV